MANICTAIANAFRKLIRRSPIVDLTRDDLVAREVEARLNALGVKINPEPVVNALLENTCGEVVNTAKASEDKPFGDDVFGTVFEPVPPPLTVEERLQEKFPDSSVRILSGKHFVAWKNRHGKSLQGSYRGADAFREISIMINDSNVLGGIR